VKTPEQFVPDQPLAGLRVLLVEDQALIAMDAEELIRSLGAIDVYVAPSVSKALEIITDNVPDCAVLDLNLGNATSEPVAIELESLGIPYIFATGYRDSVSIPERFAGVPVVRKPVADKILATSLSNAISTAARV
jgi:CheY-like chemotaxis protein